jgi:hypothetical protein
MLFSTSTSAIVAAALSIAGIASAAPAPAKVARDVAYTSTGGYYSTSTSTYAAPTATYTSTSGPATIYPKVSSQYTVSTGAINYNTGKGLVYKSPTDNGADITTLVTFYIPDSYYGSSQTCELVFDLDWSSTATGSARADVYTSLAPATTDTTTWPHGNLRDQHVGRLIAYPGQAATWEQTFQGPTFKCSDAAGMYLAGEFVGVYDQDLITWVPGVDGPKIIAY